MGKKRTNKTVNQSQQQDVTPVIVAAETDATEIKTPVKPQPTEVATVTPATEEEEAATEGVEELTTTAAQVQELELSPGGESPQGKKGRSEEETTSSAATQQSQLESPTSSVPLVSSTIVSDCGVTPQATPQPEATSGTAQSKIVELATDLAEQPIVQFLAVVAQRLAVSFLTFLFQCVSYLQATVVYSKVTSLVQEKVVDQYLAAVDPKAMATLAYDHAKTAVLTPLGLLDIQTLQGQVVEWSVAAAKEIIDEARVTAAQQKKP